MLKSRTSYREDSHARTSPLQEKVQELTERGRVFGQRCLELLGYYDPDTHSLKTCQCSFIEDFQESCLILPVSGMMRNGKLYRQKTLEHGIYERGYLSFPTPTVADTFTDNLESSQQKEALKHSVNLSQAINMEKLYPTPATRDYKGARNPETMAKTGRNPETNSLPDAVEGQNLSLIHI